MPECLDYEVISKQKPTVFKEIIAKTDMVKNNEIPIEVNKKPFETVYEIKEEEIRLPNLSEITDENGKVKLPSEFIEKLRDPQARFRVDLAVFEEGDGLKIPCPVKSCPDAISKICKDGVHARSSCGSNYTSYMKWSTEARIKCSYCDNPSHIRNWAFKCHRHSEYSPYGGTQFTTAILIAMRTKNNIDEDFGNKLLEYLEDHPYN